MLQSASGHDFLKSEIVHQKVSSDKNDDAQPWHVEAIHRKVHRLSQKSECMARYQWCTYHNTKY